MSHLADHIRVMRTLSDVWAEEFTAQTDPNLAAMAGMLSLGHRHAADRLEVEMRAEVRAAAEASRCTLTHGSKPCPACGAKA